MLHLDNSKCKTHGEALTRIYSLVFTLARQADCYVRERGFSRFQTGTQTLFKVVGVSDLALWAAKQAVFDEIPPASVKKIITGKGNATKEEVAAALIPYVGEYEYACDDESDSVAVGVAWVEKYLEGRHMHAEDSNE